MGIELYLLTLLDAQKVILCIALVSFFSKMFMGTFWGWNLPFSTFQETVGSHFNKVYLLCSALLLIFNVSHFLGLWYYSLSVIPKDQPGCCSIHLDKRNIWFSSSLLGHRQVFSENTSTFWGFCKQTRDNLLSVHFWRLGGWWQ